MDRARAILTPAQQNMERRLQDCDGCHDPENRPVFSVMVEVGNASGGARSKSMIMVCRNCAAKPIHLHLHGGGYCAPSISVHDVLGTDTIEPLQRPEVVEPEVEIIDNRRWEDDEPPPAPRARRRRQEPETPSALQACKNCGHQRGFHVNGAVCGFSTGSGCRSSCRLFME